MHKSAALRHFCLKSICQDVNTMVIANSPAIFTILENGDRLNRIEFERRYTASNIKKAELIEGLVHVASPLLFTPHAEPHGRIIGWLIAYQANAIDLNNLKVGIEPTVRLDEDNEPQPDAVLFRLGGNAQIDEDGYITGAPELVVEIAASTVSYDLHAKKSVYERNGVNEYIVWRTLDREIDWFILENSKYVSLNPDDAGIIHSREFEGLRLNIKAILNGDMAVVLHSLRSS